MFILLHKDNSLFAPFRTLKMILINNKQTLNFNTMKKAKYKNAVVILINGIELPVKSPVGRLSADYFTKHAYHYANVKQEQIKEVKLIN